MVVVLPAPFGPSKQKISPGRTRRSRLESARWAPNDLDKPTASSIGLLFVDADS